VQREIASGAPSPERLEPEVSRALIIDYAMGNLRSVQNAFRAIGCEASISSSPEDLRNAERIVLPGVGAFGDGMRNLREAGWIEPLEEEVLGKGKPFLGLCLGMQLLATEGMEHGLHEGLGWVPGRAKRLTGAGLRVPHMGWNDVRFVEGTRLFDEHGESATFYFVHSYYLDPDDHSVVSGVCSYGIDFAATVERDNIFATQFHPEKSQKAGLTALRTFASLC
jgi:glutamine amidotransferase